ncbi:MAG: phospholipase D family protein [Kiloniellales bacterium]
MARFIETAEATDQISNLIKSGNPRLAVAFWGDGAAKRLGLLSNTSGCQVICNLKMGGTNPREIKLLLDAGVSVRQLDTLHAKVYLADGGALVGSSNASANGLSFQGGECSGWEEANLRVESGPTHDAIAKWFEQLWQSGEARPVTKSDLTLAQEIWSRRRRTSIVTKTDSLSGDIIDIIEKMPHKIFDRRVFIAFYWNRYSKEAKEKIEYIQKAHDIIDSNEKIQRKFVIAQGVGQVAKRDLPSSAFERA